MTNSLTLISFLIIPTITVLVLGFYVSYQNFKNTENKYLKLLYIELESEKKISKTLKSTTKKVKELDQKTNQKLLKIKVITFNINFTLNEIL